jgi:hypothetical protein
MSLPLATVWEVRPSGGSDTNGGGFVAGASGTDYSQQNSAQFSGTDLVVSGTSATSVSHSFISTDVGNLINISAGSGLTTGFYEVVSVTGGTATLDRSAGTGTGGTWALGGALATVSTAMASAVVSNTIYLKGTYTVTAVQAFTSATFNNNTGNPFVINGYLVARDDGSQATWTTSTNSINLIKIDSVENAIFKNIIFSNTAGTKGTNTTGNAIVALSANAGSILCSNCTFTGFNVAIMGDWTNVGNTIMLLQLDNCIIESCVSHGVQTTGQSMCGGCLFQGNGGNGFNIVLGSNPASAPGIFAFFACVFYNNTGSGIKNNSNQAPTSITGNAGLFLMGCAFASNGSDGVTSPEEGSNGSMVWNCIFYGNGGYGYNAPGSGFPGPVCAQPRANAYGSNTSGARNFFPVGIGDVTLSTNPFTNPSGGDFSLNSTAGGGASCKAAGFQSTVT